MKKVLVTLYDDNYKDIADITMPNMEAYCDKFGYDLKVFRESLDPDRHIYWSKIKAVQAVLNDYDLILWNDIDSLFTDFTSDYIDKYMDMELLGRINCLDREPKDHTECYYSVSQMIFKGEENTNHFLNLSYKQTQYLGHIWPEQMAISQVATTAYRGRINFHPIAKILDPIDFLRGTHVYKIGGDSVVTVGGGPCAKKWKLDCLDLIKRMIRNV